MIIRERIREFGGRTTLRTLFTAILVLIIFALLLYCYFIGMHLYEHRYDVIDKRGQFGDAFNGTIGPAVALIAAILVYLSFREQIRANKLILEQWTFDLQHRLFEGIKKSIDDLSVTSTFGGKTHYGLEALKELAEPNWENLQNKNETLRDLNRILTELFYLLLAVSEANYYNKKYITFEIDFYLHVRFAPLLSNIVIYAEREQHPFSDDLKKGLKTLQGIMGMEKSPFFRERKLSKKIDW